MTDIHVMRDDLLPPAPAGAPAPALGRATSTRDDVERLLATARTFALSLEREMKKLPTLRGRLVVNLFFESSTRTSSSFELAAKRLSADTLSIKASRLVGGQGRVAQGHGAHARRLRPGRDRDPPPADRRAAARRAGDRRARRERRRRQAPASDAGAARPLHDPARRSAGSRALHVAIVGDVLHSRVARSLIQALDLVGARVTLVGPPPLLPRGIEAMGCETSTDIETIRDADVVYVLRMQRERMEEGANYVPTLREYSARWGVTPERLRAGQKVMHPGPMNRGVEIDPRVADSADALVATQVRAGLVVRMAVLYDLLTSGPVAVEAAQLRRWRDASFAKTPRATTSSSAARACSTRPRAVDARARRPRRRRDDRASSARGSTRTATASSRRRGSCSRRRSSTRTSTCARPAARTRRRSRPGRGRGGRRLLRDPRDAEHRSGRRLADVLRGSAAETARGRGRGPGRLHRRDHARARRARELTEMGELADAGAAGVHRRRPAGRDARADAARAPVQRDHRPAARAALRGADALARRPHAQGRRLGRARASRG